MIIYGRGLTEFLSRLREILLRLREFRILLKAKKCKYGCKSLECVDRTISKDGLSMSEIKIESVLNFPRPQTLIALRSLLGLANYFRGFVPIHSTIIAPKAQIWL